jgi:hypothetical protein
MAKILELKNTDNKKIIANLELSENEYKYLKGNIERIRIFSDDNLQKNSRLVQRGKKEATKYFLLPKSLRNGVKPCCNVRCDRLETKDKCLFIFEVTKGV